MDQLTDACAVGGLDDTADALKMVNKDVDLEKSCAIDTFAAVAFVCTSTVAVVNSRDTFDANAPSTLVGSRNPVVVTKSCGISDVARAV